MQQRHKITIALRPSRNVELLVYAQFVFNQDGRYWVNDDPELKKNTYVDTDYLDFDIDVLQGVDGSNYMPVYHYSKAMKIDSFHDEIEIQVKRFIVENILQGIDANPSTKTVFPNATTYPAKDHMHDAHSQFVIPQSNQ